MIATRDDLEKLLAVLAWKTRRGRRPVTIRKSDMVGFQASGLTCVMTVDLDCFRLHFVTEEEAARLREHQTRIAREVTP